ncbi:MAG: polysaccharide biosynthesis/export family protein [Terracidiphilus sp.]
MAFFAPSLFCHAQGAAQQAPSAATAAPDQATPAPATQAGATPDQAIPPMAPGTDKDTYVIGPSDAIVVSVWKEQSLSGSLLVRPDGMISMPLLGDVQASGLTCVQLGDQITAKLRKFVQDPKVNVVLTQIHSKFIYMLGEIGKKGPIEMTPGMTLLQAVAVAGGISEYGNAKKMYILRDEDGKHLKLHVHYKEALKGDTTLNVLLKPGDTLVVP